LHEELHAFATAVRTGGCAPVDPEDALRALALARTLVDCGKAGATTGVNGSNGWMENLELLRNGAAEASLAGAPS
jgi:hypothetical protein